MAGSSSSTVDSAMTNGECVCTIAAAWLAWYSARCMGVSVDGRGPDTRAASDVRTRQMSAGPIRSYGSPDGVIAISPPRRTLRLPEVPGARSSAAIRRAWPTRPSRSARLTPAWSASGAALTSPPRCRSPPRLSPHPSPSPAFLQVIITLPAREATQTRDQSDRAVMIMAIWLLEGGSTTPEPAASAGFHDHGHFSAYRAIRRKVSVIMEVALVEQPDRHEHERGCGWRVPGTANSSR